VPWAKLSDDFHSHRRVASSSLEAIGLYAKALSYVARYLTDGLVDEGYVRREIPGKQRRKRIVAELLESGLWEIAEGGYTIRSYLKHNPTREQVEAKREAQSRGGRKAMQRRWTDRAEQNLRHAGAPDDGEAEWERDLQGIRTGELVREPLPDKSTYRATGKPSPPLAYDGPGNGAGEGGRQGSATPRRSEAERLQDEAIPFPGEGESR
jgi:hypothetical protein